MLHPDGSRGYVEIASLEARIMDAIRTRDISALDQVLADDFLYRTPGGSDAGRAEFLDVVRSLPYAIRAIVGDGVRVNLFGSTAVVTGIQVATVRDHAGIDHVSRTAFTDVFISRGGEWRLVLAWAVEIPAT